MDNITTYRKPIFQLKPIFLDDYLSQVLNLPVDSKVVSQNIIEDRVTDTARVIKLLITWEAHDEKVYKKNLFLKLPNIEKENNSFDKWSMHEIDFYRNANINDELPLVKCYDAYISDDKKYFLLLLEDISDEFCSANEINRNEMGNWLTATESLAKLHTFYWNGLNSCELKSLHGDNKSIEEKENNYHNALEKFLPYASAYYDNKILDTYHLALEDAIVYERRSNDRREQNRNITVINGDSHIFNFMFPKASSEKPVIIDFQFWRIGLPTVDIMNLIRVAFPFMKEPERHLELLKYYHTFLLDYGVTDYNFNECLHDYYLSTAMAVFGPVFNYYDFGLGHEYWGQGVFDTIHNYRIAKELLNKLK